MILNSAAISAVIAVVTIVLAIFGAQWINLRSIERLLEQTEKKSDARTDTVLAEVKRLDHRIDFVEQRLDSLERHLEQRLDRIERQLEAIFKPVLPPRS